MPTKALGVSVIGPFQDTVLSQYTKGLCQCFYGFSFSKGSPIGPKFGVSMAQFLRLFFVACRAFRGAATSSIIKTWMIAETGLDRRKLNKFTQTSCSVAYLSLCTVLWSSSGCALCFFFSCDSSYTAFDDFEPFRSQSSFFLLPHRLPNSLMTSLISASSF